MTVEPRIEEWNAVPPDRTSARDKGWVELARIGIALALLVALAVIGVTTYSAVNDAREAMERGSLIGAADAAADLTYAYMRGGLLTVMAVGGAIALHIGTRAFD